MGMSWQHEADTLSGFALTFGLNELCLAGAGFGGSATVDTETALGSLRRSLRPIDVPPLQWPVESRDTGFLVGDGLVLLFENEFLFVASAEDNAADYLAERARPGLFEWNERRPPWRASHGGGDEPIQKFWQTLRPDGRMPQLKLGRRSSPPRRGDRSRSAAGCTGRRRRAGT